MVGRPTKLTGTQRPDGTWEWTGPAAEVLENARTGAAWQLCADAAGVSRTTVKSWRDRGAAGEPMFAAFLADLKRIEATAGIESTAKVRAGDAGWQGAAWFLERRMQDLYGRDRVEPRDETPRSKAEAQRMVVKAATALGLDVPDEWLAALEGEG